MNRIFTVVLTLGLSAFAANSAEACCLWPFGGWWGAGYGGGYYSAGYTPYVPVADGYYSAGYGSAGCCMPACCDPCGSGGCASGSCVGTTPAGSLKPETDPNFDKGLKKYEDEDFDRDRLRRREDPVDPDPALDRERDLQTRSRERTPAADPDPIDDFRSTPMGGAASDLEPFGSGSDQIKNKPPMADPGTDLPAGDLPAVDALDPSADNTLDPAPEADPGTGGSTFFDEDKKPAANETRVERQLSLKVRPTSLNEVITPKRLASRSLPATRVEGKTSFAGRSGDERSATKPPVRWISVPLPEGNVRL